ncbi:MAG: tetratricopeptide repeat protein [Candidatus Acidiferrales bacterium]
MRASADHAAILKGALLALLSALLTAGASAQSVPPSRPGQNAPPERITLDGSEQMFATMCALHAAGFEADVSAAGLHPLRARLRETLLQQHGPAVDALRTFYKQHELSDPAATLSRYIWFALVTGPPPLFDPAVRHEELPPEALALEGFREILEDYYREQNIGQLWREAQPVYQQEIARLHDPVSQILLVTRAYVREMTSLADPRTFSIIVEPMVGRKTNVRNYGDHYAIVLSGMGEFPADLIRHAFLHFLLDAIPMRYSHVIASKHPLLDVAARAPRLPVDLRDDFAGFFSECLVRAVEIQLRQLAPSELAAILNEDDADGYVLVRPLVAVLPKYEKSEPSMKEYFPDMVRAIDTAAEMKRLQNVQFALADRAPDAGAEVIRVERRPPATIPDDPEALAELTEGERQIAAKHPREAERAFQKVIARYPEQPRARYGLALVALLDGDVARARQILGRLVGGESKAANDPMVLAMAHVYLGRISENEGHVAEALAEYRAASAVEGAPGQALEAAKRGIESTESRLKQAKP